MTKDVDKASKVPFGAVIAETSGAGVAQRPSRAIPPLLASRTLKLDQCGSGEGWRKLPKPERGSTPRDQVTRHLPLDRIDLYASRYQRTLWAAHTIGEMPITIQTAAQNKQIHVVRSLISGDTSVVNSVDIDGRTALHWAAFSGALDITQHLLEQKAEVDKIDGSGWTALHIAVSAGNEDVVRELVGAGADVKKPNDKGLTPLHYAASKSRVDIAKFLIERGADINAKDKANQTPLHRAATTGSTGMIAVLLKPPQGSPKTRLNTADRIGNTPLHLAMESAHAEAAIMLIEAGADRSRENLDNETPEQVAGVDGQEQKRAREYVISRCGPPT